MKPPSLLPVFLLAFVTASLAADVVHDISFATVAGQELKLDLYRPDHAKPVGLIIWVHGGAWSGGSRKSPDLQAMTELGWAVASVDYRLSKVAKFPAQIHDIKAALRFLRAHADEYGYPATRFIIAGSSAGGHLAALVGVTNGDRELEGTVGGNPQTSSDIQAIVDMYGASNLTTILAQSTPHGLSVRQPALDLLLGGQPEAVPELARLASPVFHVDRNDPPLLLLHGDQDPQMPINQAHELQGAYEKAGLSAQFIVLHGSAHGGPAFKTEATLALIDRWLRAQLKIEPMSTPLMPQVRPAILLDPKFGVTNIGINATNQKFGAYGLYLQRMTETVQLKLDQLIAHSREHPPAGSTVVVKFTLNPEGRIARIANVENHSSEEAARIAVTAITAPAPYGSWTDEMKTALDPKGEELTFSFFFN